MRKEKVIIILGQTATGKSALAVKIALRLSSRQAKKAGINGAEVISADSRQVYKGLDIGTGKIPRDKKISKRYKLKDISYLHKGIPHHLLDVANPKNKFTVAEYQKLAISAIVEIIKRGKIPIICGGTGFYIHAITKGTVFPEVSPNQKLRKFLYSKSAVALFEYLKKLDSKRAKDIKNKNEQNNKVRLIRAIEIARILGRVPKIAEVIPPHEFIKIGLCLPPEKLKKKIEKRLIKRINIGMVEEAKKLHQKGLTWRKMNELGLEYRYTALYLQKKINKKEMIKKLSCEIYKYAKRQMTWFKRDKKIKWFDASDKNLGENILSILRKDF